MKSSHKVTYDRPRFRLAMLACSLALLAAPAANACQLVCIRTAAVYDGAGVGGLSGGDAKCASEYPGFKFVRNGTILENMQHSWMSYDNAGSTYNDATAWVAGVQGHPNSCATWTSNSSGVTGYPVVAAWNYTSYAGNTTATCNNKKPLWCCNM